MWLSNRQKTQVAEEAKAEFGEVSLSGAQIGVYVSGERRNVEVLSLGGYHWRPQLGEQVLVLKAGQQGEQPCILGTPLTELGSLEEGEVMIMGPNGDSAIKLGQGGVVDLIGTVYVNGIALQVEQEDETGGIL